VTGSGIGTLTGRRCGTCGNASPNPNARRCTGCGSSMDPAELPRRGSVWSSTVIHGDGAPIGLSYVDLVGGPRVLVRFEPTAGAPRPGDQADVEMRDGMPYLRRGSGP